MAPDHIAPPPKTLILLSWDDIQSLDEEAPNGYYQLWDALYRWQSMIKSIDFDE
jgi:hypothetical protein